METVEHTIWGTQKFVCFCTTHQQGNLPVDLNTTIWIVIGIFNLSLLQFNLKEFIVAIQFERIYFYNSI